MRTIYVETKLNIPVASHSALITLQEANDIDLGFHHHDKNSAQKMVYFISNTMHDALMTYITNSKNPMSIILDSSTDASQHHYLVVYFQSLENYAPVLYFYKLIPLQIDESAAGHFNVLKKQWQEEL